MLSIIATAILSISVLVWSGPPHGNALPLPPKPVIVHPGIWYPPPVHVTPAPFKPAIIHPGLVYPTPPKPSNFRCFSEPGHIQRPC